MRWVRLLAVTGMCAGLIAAAPSAAASAVPSAAASTGTTTPIKHIVVLMQSGHSFDNYFGTYLSGCGSTVSGG